MYDLTKGWRPEWAGGTPSAGGGAGGGAAAPDRLAVRRAGEAPPWSGSVQRGPAPKYPFATMGVHETFYVEVGPDQPKWAGFRVYVYSRGRDLGRKFRCHRYPDGRYAVWRES